MFHLLVVFLSPSRKAAKVSARAGHTCSSHDTGDTAVGTGGPECKSEAEMMEPLDLQHLRPSPVPDQDIRKVNISCSCSFCHFLLSSSASSFFLQRTNTHSTHPPATPSYISHRQGTTTNPVSPPTRARGNYKHHCQSCVRSTSTRQSLHQASKYTSRSSTSASKPVCASSILTNTGKSSSSTTSTARTLRTRTCECLLLICLLHCYPSPPLLCLFIRVAHQPHFELI